MGLRDRYYQEELNRAYEGRPSVPGSIWRVLRGIIAAIVTMIVLFYLLRWAATEYYITTHCTMVLGTRVCQ